MNLHNLPIFPRNAITKKAFSFIEISVVIVVIGILIAGVVQGRDMLNDMRINSARSFTEKSPVSSMQNLALWLETTQQNSLFINTNSVNAPLYHKDNQAIGRWNDLNSDPNLKVNLLQATEASKPIFIFNAINGLPALRFDGVNDYLQNVNKFYYNNFTAFFVALPMKICATGGGIYFGTSGQSYITYPQHGGVINEANVTSAAGFGVSLCTNQIATVEHSSSYMPSRTLNTGDFKKPVLFTVSYANKVATSYVNSKSAVTGAASGYNVYLGFNVGGGGNSYENYGYYSGFVGEVIYFSQTLSDEDRKLVDNYLIEKWQIK